MTFSLGGTCSPTAALVRPIRGRRSKMSTSPSRSPSTSTVPWLANNVVAATWSRVVLPAPFGPMRIQRSSSCAVQSTLRSRTAASRRTSTPRSRSTSSDIRGPLQLVISSRPNLRHRTPVSPDYRGPCRHGPRSSGTLVADREQRGLGAVLHAQLGQHRADVGLDRLLRDVQGAGDLAVGAALGQFGQDLALAGGERVQARGLVLRAEQAVGGLGGEQQVAV